MQNRKTIAILIAAILVSAVFIAEAIAASLSITGNAQVISVTGHGPALLTKNQAERWLFSGKDFTFNFYKPRTYDYSTDMTIEFTVKADVFASAKLTIDQIVGAYDESQGPPYNLQEWYAYDFSQHQYVFRGSSQNDNIFQPNTSTPVPKNELTITNLPHQYISPEGYLTIRYHFVSQDHAQTTAVSNEYIHYMPIQITTIEI